MFLMRHIQNAANAVRKHFGHAAEQLRTALDLDHLGVFFDEVSLGVTGSMCVAAGINALAGLLYLFKPPTARRLAG